MSAFRALLAEREARVAVAIWAIVPTLFLFFAMTLAVDPAAHLDRLRIGVTNLDAGISTPQGQLSLGTELSAGLAMRLQAEIVPFATEGELRGAVLGRVVNGGIVFPPAMTADLQAGRSVQPAIVRSEANDPFSNAFTATLGTNLAAAIGAAAPTLRGEAPAPALATVVPQNVAAAKDFRLVSLPASLLLPLWMATVAFSVLLARAGDRARPAAGAGRVAVAELALAALGAASTALVIAAGVPLFTGLWDLDLVGLFGVLWLGLVAMSWLVLGTVRLVGLAAGALLAVLALFVQQPVSGAAFPASFAPDVVRWLEPIAPLRAFVEAIRDVAVGGSTLPAMATSLAILAFAGAVLMAAGALRLATVASHSAAAPQAQPA